ncbi:Superkiller viralicidic activity 2-like 2 [Tritrichomonas foetus]|uniref:Superkiller viralicidic activity 2-like 2 n=1 Tax=Tritrichomonas foetus TaxID=1144522 RepID=A0A1J4JTK8_9EUKA|nr:Superkiller viralicidic activity 2-like 2 [Tritrichomonas foetus]|eukprot:OHT00605.1 Superkiller viralicidic activity 2-like 2 [Tritrichomonas foetus]
MLQEPPELEQSSTPKSIQFNTGGDNVIHYAALPGGKTSLEPVKFPENPVLEYDFELDEFQRESIACVHNRESVLVSAHTSAGKTAIAYYAVKMALDAGSRVVYTSPIKALSNQKYRELKEKFGDVGLVTGDITLNMSASILVMTTEILRMMLYRGDSLVRELSWVIYDEIHYMRDIERGVVWEESIILLPHEVRFVFLSATIPNAREFSEWIAQIHKQPCHVVYTEYRPVPLKYYIAPPGIEPIIVKEADGRINEGAFQAAFEAGPKIENSGSSKRVFVGVNVHEMKKNKQNKKQKGNKVDKNLMATITAGAITRLVDMDLSPMIVFAFGRKECDDLPKALGNVSFISEEESESIEQLLDVSIEKLNDSDKNLPQIATLRALLVRGIAVHHGGLIPLMKELIELLFQHGLVKILFATETFAMGLNMPARTVLFHSLIKFDGSQRRLLSGGEFIQMSGRAGRRNNDNFGAVVISASGEADKDQTHDLLTSGAQPLNSEFHVTYHMLLSLLCTQQMEPKFLMNQSFHQFQMERELPVVRQQLAEKEAELESVKIEDEDKVRFRVEIDEQIIHYTDAEKSIVAKPDNVGELLKPGRFVEVDNGWGWGVVVNNGNKKSSEILVALKGQENAAKELVPVNQPSTQNSDSTSADGENQSEFDPSKVSAFVFSVPLEDIKNVSIIIRDMSSDPCNPLNIQRAFKQIDQSKEKGIPCLERKDIVNVEKDRYNSICLKIEQLKKKKPLFDDVTDHQIELYLKKREIRGEIRNLKDRIRDLTTLVMQEDLESMQRVLKKLGFTDENNLITDKGRVASVITAGDELVMTEMLFDGILTDLTPQKIAALLCVFACDEGSKEEAEIPEAMIEVWDKTKSIIERVVNASNECGLKLDLEEYQKKIDPTYMMLTFNWAGGAEFSTLMEENDSFFEGSVIRSMKRSEEILRQAAKAAKQMGNADLEINILEAINIIKRDIIFAASLYL